MKTDLYETITNRIIENLESVNPSDYKKPWFDIGVSPFNAISKKAYRGINHIVLGFNGYESKAYATYKQWQEKDCQVRKGEKGHIVVFWHFEDRKNEETGETKKSVWLKHYTVFNASQVDGDFARTIESKPLRALNDHEALTAAADCIFDYTQRENIQTIHEDRAYYSPSADKIAMPKIGQFEDRGAYYAVYLHEMTHSTGHAKRLNRDLSGGFGSASYAKEELIAELGAAMLCGALGISQTPRLDHAQYIASWLQALKGDKRFIFTAAGQAQKAADFILKTPEDKTAAE